VSPLASTGDHPAVGVSARVDQVCARVDMVTRELRTLAEIALARPPLRSTVPPQR
jgi:hypothetical protein